MKKTLPKNRWWIVFAIFSLFILQACEKNSFVEFAPLEKGEKKIEEKTGALHVKSYSYVCNPDANAQIDITFVEAGTHIHSAKNLSPAQFTALIAILNTGKATFIKADNAFTVLDIQPKEKVEVNNIATVP